MSNSLLPLDSTSANLHTQLMLSIGIVVVAMIDGALLALGIACLFLLSPRKRLPSKQSKYLQVYIVLLLLANFGYEAAFFLWNNLPSIFKTETITKQRKISDILVFVGKLTPSVLIGLSDGIVVWRCYRVHQVLGPNEARKWNIFWLFPLILWFVTAVTCIVGGALIETSRLGKVASGIQAAGYASNILLNVYFGPGAPTQRHVRIVSILLESAAINIPITIAGAVGIGTAELFGLIVVTVAITCQSLTSVILILLIALGRVVDQKQHVETEGNTRSSQQPYVLSFPVSDPGSRATYQGPT